MWSPRTTTSLVSNHPLHGAHAGIQVAENLADALDGPFMTLMRYSTTAPTQRLLQRLPYALARLRPARTRSTIMRRSTSAKTLVICSMALPWGVFFHRLGSTRRLSETATKLLQDNESTRPAKHCWKYDSRPCGLTWLECRRCPRQSQVRNGRRQALSAKLSTEFTCTRPRAPIGSDVDEIESRGRRQAGNQRREWSAGRPQEGP